MRTPDITPIQKGAGALYGTVALACLAAGITGTDLLAYLVSAALVSAGAMWADRGIRNGRASIEEAAQYGATYALDDEA